MVAMEENESEVSRANGRTALSRAHKAVKEPNSPREDRGVSEQSSFLHSFLPLLRSERSHVPAASSVRHRILPRLSDCRERPQEGGASLLLPQHLPLLGPPPPSLGWLVSHD
eukprot:GHVU01158669.1.p1 GENE.GHVU01158669.1~~GHVU01158669.1.p1  ORF type:complete len:112 (-),score=9.58 GHVU01158669.1:102-437(-)